jgi:hypothetical protein
MPELHNFKKYLKYMMPHYPTWDYYPMLHNFEYTADIRWPGRMGEQLDWIIGIVTVETWLETYTGSKYQRWAWNMATECYDISVAFKYDKHKTLFLLQWAR